MDILLCMCVMCAHNRQADSCHLAGARWPSVSDPEARMAHGGSSGFLQWNLPAEMGLVKPQRTIVAYYFRNISEMGQLFHLSVTSPVGIQGGLQCHCLLFHFILSLSEGWEPTGLKYPVCFLSRFGDLDLDLQNLSLILQLRGLS